MHDGVTARTSLIGLDFFTAKDITGLIEVGHTPDLLSPCFFLMGICEVIGVH